MKKVLFAVIALSAILVSCNKKCCGNCHPENDTVAVSEEKAEAQGELSEGLEAIRIAMDLAQYGYRVESADALIKAADILASTPKVDMPEEQVAEKNNPEAKVEDKDNDKGEITAEKLIADAKEMAGDDAHLLAMAADVEKKIAAASESTRGAVNGPIEHYDRILARDYDLYYIPFRAGEIAEVAVIGDGDTDLDLYVYDANGNLIVSDTSYSGNCYVSFLPYVTSNFTIKIVNRGNVYNNYVLLTN
ncbi:MAG: hypothetical protein IK073_05035 [Paludibacteraceae bacterium]|nr:hypothetical protein [Paludibacteraceae bacterium]